MLYLLDRDVKTVKWNGIPLHEARSAIVKEELNGDFVLTVKYPITDSGVYKLIKEDMLMKCPVPVLGAQLFRIKKPVEQDDELDITAYHISDDVMQRSIKPMSINRQGCYTALSQMVQNAKTALGDFSFTSDIADNHTFNTDETETLYTVLMDGKHSIVGTWEGELVRDNFALTVKKARGADRGVIITTHKSLKSYERTKNSQNVVTRIHARSTFSVDVEKSEASVSGENTTVKTQEERTISVTVDSPLIGNYPYINEKEYQNNDLKTEEELRKWAEAKFKNEGIDKPSDAIKIEAYEIDGQVVHMGDTVNIKSWKHDVDLYKKAVAYEFDALTEKYLTITFDDTASYGGGGNAGSSGVSSVADAILGTATTAQEIAIERAIENANRAFDATFEKGKEAIEDSIEQVKADAEVYADGIREAISSRVDALEAEWATTQEAQARRVSDILAKAGSTEDLSKEAQRLASEANAKALQMTSEAAQKLAQMSQEVSEAKASVQDQAEKTATFLQDLDGVKERFDSLRVGARNYAEDYEFSRGMWEYSQGDSSPRNWTVSKGVYTVTGTTDTWKQYQIHSESGGRLGGKKDSTLLLKLEKGKPYTLSFQARCLSGNPEVWISLRENRKSSVGGNPERLYGGARLTAEWQTYHFTTQSLVQSEEFDYWRIILGYNKIGTVAFRKVELVEGQMVTDAGPAEEDFRSEFADYKRTVEENSAQLGRTVVDLEGKTTRVETLALQTAQDVLTKASLTELNKATGRLTTAETELRTLAGKVTEKLSRTEVESLVDGKGYATTSAMTNAITKSAEGVTQLITKVEGKIPTDIGAVNLLLNTATLPLGNRLNGTWMSTSGGNGSATVVDLDGMPSSNLKKAVRVVNNTNGGNKDLAQGVNLVVGYTYTISCWARVSSTSSQNSVNLLMRSWTTSDANKILLKDINHKEWKRYSVTFIADAVFNSIQFGQNGGGIIEICGMKLERGSIATDWSPASEDLVTVTAFQEVRETAQLYERILGKTEGDIASNLARQVITSELMQTEIRKIPTKTSSVNLVANSKINESSNAYGFGGRTVNLVAGKTYFFGARAKRTGGTSEKHVLVALYYPDWSTSVGVRFTNSDYEIKFSKYTATKSGEYKINSYWYPRDGDRTGTADVDWYMVVESDTQPTDWSPAPEDMATATRVTQLADSYAIQSLGNANQVLSAVNVATGGVSLQAGQNKLVVTPTTTYIQDGTIKNAMIETLHGGKIMAGTVTALALSANSVTADKLLVDQAFFNKLMANEAYLQQLFAKNAFITQVQAVTLSASKISGGLLQALNGAMAINLNSGQILYYTDQAAIKRILSGYPTQFVKFATGTANGRQVGVTVIGSNRNGTESSNDGGFVGIRAWNGAQDDMIDVVGDTVRLASAAYDDADGWNIITLPGKLSIDAYRNSDRPSSRLSIGDVHLYRNSNSYTSLMDVLQQFNLNFKHLINIVGRGDVILTWDTIK